MLDKFFKKNNLFKNYMLSFMVILLVPIIITGFFMYSYLARRVRTESLNSVRMNLLQVQDIIDMQVQMVNNTSYQIIYNNKIKPFFYTDDLEAINIYTYYQAIEEMKDFRSSNLYIKDIYFYFLNENIVLSSNSKYSKEAFWGYIFNKGSENIEQMDSYIKNIPKTAVVSSQYMEAMRGPGDTILFLYRQPSADLKYKAVLIITVNAVKIRDLINISTEHFDGMVVIRDENNLPFISTFNDNLQEYISTDISNVNGWYRQRLDGENYYVLNVKSYNTGYCYSAYVRTSFIMKSFYITCGLIILVIFICMTGGFLLAYKFAQANYLPVKNILNIINNTDYNSGDYYNEYVRIAIAIKSYLSDNEELSKKLDKLQPEIHSGYLRKLLKGSYVDMAAFSELNKKLYNLPFNSPYCVVLFKIEEYETSVDFDDSFLQFTVKNVSEEMMLTIGAGYTTVLENGNIAAIITSFENSLTTVTSLCEKIQKFLVTHLSISTTIGVGNIYHETFDISKSFIEANSALEYRMVLGKNTIITFGAISEHIHYSLPEIDSRKFFLQLKKGNFEGIKATLLETLEATERNKITIDAARCIYFDIINTAVKVLVELNDADYSHVISRGDILPNLLQCQTLRELYQASLEFYQLICTTSINDDTELAKDVLAHIDENCCDPNYSLSLIAECFHVSSAFMSQFIKSRTGKSFVDYLHSLRLANAKELLISTDLNLSDIAKRTGYNDSHSLIRIFKKYMGVTPGKYREADK